MYCGAGNKGWALQDRDNGHRWSNARDMNADTLCVKSHRGEDSFTFNKYQFKRVKVSGYMTASNILKACSGAKMRPVCDHSNYADGKCRMVGGAWHFSHPSHDRTHGIIVRHVKGAYFYSGNQYGGR